MNRRLFLRHASGAAAGLMLPGCMGLRPSPPATAAVRPGNGRRLIIVVFGGGTRYSESIGDPDHRYIPRLWNELVPQGTLFTDVRVEGRVVHTNCTASIVTGHREYDADNDWSRPVDHPTVFEIVRRAHRAPDTAVWAFVYASILAGIGHSRAAGFGLSYAANVVEPPTIPRQTAESIGARLQETGAAGRPDGEVEAASWAARSVRAESTTRQTGLRSEQARRLLDREFRLWQSGTGTTSHDAFLTQSALAAMREFAPEVITVAFGEIDCAHYGAWSRYTDAIRRTDELTARLWQSVGELPAYRENTLMLVLPDHGRELERPDGLGYVHHSDFYTRRDEDEGCRRTWMLLLGPGIARGRTIPAPVRQTAAAATGLEFMGLQASAGATPSVLRRAG